MIILNQIVQISIKTKIIRNIKFKLIEKVIKVKIVVNLLKNNLI